MSDNPSPIQIPIVFDLESQQAAQSLSAVQKLIAATRSEVEAFANRGGLGQLAERSGLIDDAQNQITDLGITLARTAGEAELLNTAITEVGQDSVQFNSLTARLNDVQTEARRAVNELEGIPTALEGSAQAARRAQFQEAVGGISGLGSFEGLFTNTRGLLGSGGSLAGLDQDTIDSLSKILELGGDLTGTIDAIPRALKGFEDMRHAIDALGGVDAAKDALDGFKNSIGQINLESLKANKGAITAVAGLGALGIGIAALAYIANESKSELDDYIAAQKGARDRQLELNNLVSQINSPEDLRRQQQANALRRQQIQEEVRGLEEQIAQNTNTRIRAVADSKLIQAATFDVFDTTSIGLDLLGVNTDNADTRLKELNEELRTVDAAATLLNNTLVAVALAAQEAESIYFKQLDFEKQRLQLIESGTPEQVAQLRDAAEQEREAIYNTFADFGDTIQDQVLTAARGAGLEEELQALFRDSVAFGGDIPTQTNAYVELARLLGIELPESLINTVDTFNEQIDRMDELDEALGFLNSGDIQEAIALRDKQQQQLAALNDSTKEVVKSEETHAAAIDALTASNEAAIEAETKRNQQLLDDAAKTSQELTDLETRRAEALQKQREAEAEAAVVASFKAQIEAAKAVEAEQARAVKVSSLRQEAQANELEAQQKHQATLARQQAQFDLQQRRREEDLADDLDEAAADRDVKSFLRIQKDGEKELDRAAEDNDLRLKEQRESLDDQVREIRRNAEERIRAERDSGQRRLTQSQRLEQALGEYQANAAQQRQLRQRQIEEQAYQERVTALRNHMALITRELLNGVTPLFRGGLGAIGGLPSVPAAATGTGIRPGGAGAAIAITIQQQNVGRIPSHDDINRANQDLANKVVSGVNRALAGIRRN